MTTAAATVPAEPDAFQELTASGRKFRCLLHKGVYVAQLFHADGSLDIETTQAHREAASAYEELNSRRILFAEADGAARDIVYLEEIFRRAGL